MPHRECGGFYRLITSYFKSSSNCFSHAVLFSSTWPFRDAKHQRGSSFPRPSYQEEKQALQEKLASSHLRSENSARWPEERRVWSRPRGRGLDPLFKACSRNMLEMHFLRPHLKSTESGTLAEEPKNLLSWTLQMIPTHAKFVPLVYTDGTRCFQPHTRPTHPPSRGPIV